MANLQEITSSEISHPIPTPSSFDGGKLSVSDDSKSQSQQSVSSFKLQLPTQEESKYLESQLVFLEKLKSAKGVSDSFVLLCCAWAPLGGGGGGNG